MTSKDDFYKKHITQVTVDNFLGFIPTSREYEKVAVQEFNEVQDELHGMKVVSATAEEITFNGMKPADYAEFRKVAGY